MAMTQQHVAGERSLLLARLLAAVRSEAAVHEFSAQRREAETVPTAIAETVDDIRHRVQREKPSRGELPRELTPDEAAEVKAFGDSE